MSIATINPVTGQVVREFEAPEEVFGPVAPILRAHGLREFVNIKTVRGDVGT